MKEEKKSKILWIMAALALVMISAIALYPIFKVDISKNSKESKEVSKSIEKALKERTGKVFPKGEYKVNFSRNNNCWSTTALVSDADLINLTGKEKVDNLSMRFCDVTAKGYSALENEPLGSLALYAAVLGPDEVKAISRCKSLRELTLRDNPKINDELIKYLTGPKTLQELSLKKTGVGNQALAHLAKTFPDLFGLELWGNKSVNASGLKELAKLKSLENLTLNEIPLDEEALHTLALNRKLKRLQLVGCQISDKALSQLKGSRVKHLNISKNPITGSSLPILASLPNLKMVVLNNCPNLTREAIVNLKRAVPKVRVRTNLGKNKRPKKS